MTAQVDDKDMTVLERVLAARYSCRAFKPDPVPRAMIERILTAAQRTASWSNSQSWQVHVLGGSAARTFADVMYKAASDDGESHAGDFPFPREYRGIYLDRRRETGFQLYGALGIVRGDKSAYRKQSLENFRLFGAPHGAIITSDEALGVYGAVDCGGYVSNFMLAAQAMGLATIAQAALASHSDVIRAHLGIGADRCVVCGISFGYPDKDHPANSYRTRRAGIPEAVTFVGD